jgi:hypothetical protein
MLADPPIGGIVQLASNVTYQQTSVTTISRSNMAISLHRNVLACSTANRFQIMFYLGFIFQLYVP